MADGATLFPSNPSALTPAQVAGLIPAANLLINPDFRINQRGYVSGAALAAGVYGHDRWKAGAAGGDYSFTQLASSTPITIASGKSLIQVVEDKNVAGGSYVVSWPGTALGRVGVNSATPSGAYAASPILITGQTAGTTMSVEFGPGTIGTVKFEQGSVPTPFVMPDYQQELERCQRYCVAYTLLFMGITITPTWATGAISFPTRMRATPTLVNASFVATPANGTPSVSILGGQVTADGAVVGNSANNWSGTLAASQVQFTGQFTAEL